MHLLGLHWKSRDLKRGAKVNSLIITDFSQFFLYWSVCIFTRGPLSHFGKYKKAQFVVSNSKTQIISFAIFDSYVNTIFMPSMII